MTCGCLQLMQRVAESAEIFAIAILQIRCFRKILILLERCCVKITIMQKSRIRLSSLIISLFIDNAIIEIAHEM